MPRLNDVIHFRGETVTLYATFKRPTSESAGELLVPFTPAIEIEFATSLGNIDIILSKRPMIAITSERYYFDWTIPADATLTVYNAVMSGEIEGKEIKSTEEVIVADPNVTTNRNFLRYGSQSFLHESRAFEPRIHPQLPQGEF